MLRLLRWMFIAAVVAVGAASGAFYYYANNEIALKQSPLAFDLKAGSSFRGAARQMADAGAIGDPQWFVLLGRLMGDATQIKAGNYEIESPITPLQLLRKITRGDFTQVAVTFIEGWTFRQVRAALDEHASVRHESQDLSDRDLARRIGVPDDAPEGWFFPDTYHFSKNAGDIAILRRAHGLMQTRLKALWEKRDASLPLRSPYEALILASIVEKETGRASERTMVASVFVNRLRLGMRLQTDPTVIYGMGDAFDGNIRKRDLTTDTPWNTYTRAGLPPTPIAMPGMASLQAALNPAASNALYFVSRGDGTSQFSRTLEEHNAAVTKYQRSGRR
jgi:UPF0755 protein